MEKHILICNICQKRVDQKNPDGEYDPMHSYWTSDDNTAHVCPECIRQIDKLLMSLSSKIIYELLTDILATDILATDILGEIDGR